MALERHLSTDDLPAVDKFRSKYLEVSKQVEKCSIPLLCLGSLSLHDIVENGLCKAKTGHAELGTRITI